MQFTDKYDKLLLLLFAELNPAAYQRREMKTPMFVFKEHNFKNIQISFFIYLKYFMSQGSN